MTYLLFLGNGTPSGWSLRTKRTTELQGCLQMLICRQVEMNTILSKPVSFLTNQPTNQIKPNKIKPNPTQPPTWIRVPPKKPIVTWLIKKFPACYGTHCVHKSLPLIPILSQMNPVHTLPPYFPKIHSNITSCLCLGLPSDLFSSGFSTKILYAFLICPR